MAQAADESEVAGDCLPLEARWWWVVFVANSELRIRAVSGCLVAEKGETGGALGLKRYAT